jgi:hypothetical protein
VAVGSLVSLPLSAWPVALFGGSSAEVLDSIKPYGVLYIAFGFLFSAWYSTSSDREELPPAPR